MSGRPSRNHPGWLVFAAAQLALGACGVDATFSVVHAPRFAQTTCVPALPAARADYPATTWAALSTAAPVICAGPDRGGLAISGLDFLLRYDKVGGATANDIAIQSISAAGTIQGTLAACGDTNLPLVARLVEYFHVPANDLISVFACCEERIKDVRVSGQVVVVDRTALPASAQAALPAIPTGEKAALLGPALSAADLATVRRRVAADHQISWGGTYDYDGCSPPPNSTTPCGSGHCLTLSWTDSNGRGSANHAGP